MSRLRRVRFRSASRRRSLHLVRFQIWRRTIIQRLQATSNVSPISPENHMGESRQYTTQLGAGLGMVQETFDLLRLWQHGDTPKQLSDKAIRTGVFSRTTARRARNIVIEMFAPRFLADGGKSVSYLKCLIESNIPADDLTQLFFLYTARAQLIFADFVTDVYWPRYNAGAIRLGRVDAETFIHRALDNGRMQKRWTESTVRRVSGYLLGCGTNFGLLSDMEKSERAIKRFAIRP